MKNSLKYLAAFAATLMFSAAAHAGTIGGTNGSAGGYVLCNNGMMAGWSMSGNPSYQSAVALCNANGGGVAPRVFNPRTGYIFLDAVRPTVSFPRDMDAQPLQAVPEVAAALKGIVQTGARADELKGMILKNDADGIRQLLMASGPVTRMSAAAIRRAYIGPVMSPILWIPNGTPACNNDPLLYLIGGVMVMSVNTTVCAPQQ